MKARQRTYLPARQQTYQELLGGEGDGEKQPGEDGLEFNHSLRDWWFGHLKLILLGRGCAILCNFRGSLKELGEGLSHSAMCPGRGGWQAGIPRWQEEAARG